jgi:1-acyl-sn-glycerol-3-phosphate acyltransferase
MPAGYARPVQTTHYAKGEARSAFSETGFDRTYWNAVRGSRVLCRVTSRVDVPPGIELPTDRPLIIAANHSSMFDLLAALVFLGHYGLTTRIGVNSRFFTNPVAGAFFRGIGCIPFSRDDRESAERATVEALLAGQVAALMPEGRITRIEDQVRGVGPARPGISRIARRANAVVLPVAFTNSDGAWRPGTPLPKPRLGRHHVLALVGSPLEFHTDDHEANTDAIMDAIGTLVLEGRSLTDDS